MALTPQNNEAFLREVDDELRRDQMAGIGRRYGLWIVVAIVAILVAFGGWTYWQHHKANAAGQEGETLAKAIEDLGSGRSAQAAGPLATLAGSDSAAMKATALFTQADVLLGKNDTKGAAAKFAAVANDASLPQPFRDLALVRQTATEYDSLQPQAVIDRLRGLASKDSAWFGSAGEMVAIAYIRQNKTAEAGKLYGEIAQTDNVPESIRQRAVQMAGSLGVDAIQEPQSGNQAAAQ